MLFCLSFVNINLCESNLVKIIQNFTAINQKYFKWLETSVKKNRLSGEALTQLHYDVDWGDIPVQDGIDTINAVKELMGGKTNEVIEHVLEGFYKRLKLGK